MQQRTKIAVAVAVALQTLMISAVEAQEAPQRVEITGSRIRQVDLETAQPVQVVNQEQIQKSGLVTVGDIVNQLSSVGTPAFSRGTVLSGAREQGGQYINMRNLGSQRLLVLVNGKRWTASVGGFTDMSTVPSALIERIEVLKDGASSIYGSDAIAGVVNIILKKTMQGGSASAYVGENEQGDGTNKDFSVTYGAGDEKASLLFGLTHTTQGEVWAKDRNLTAFTFGPTRYNSGLVGAPWGRIGPVNASGGQNTSAATGGFNRMINHTGTFDGVGVSSESRNPANYHTYAAADADVYNATQQMHLLTPNQMTSIFTKGEVALPWDLRLTSTAMYAVRDSSRQVAGYPLSSLSQPKFPVYIDKDNWYNPYGNAVAGAGRGIDLFFTRRTIEVPRVTDNTNRTLHLDAALEGSFELRNLPWNWSVSYNYNKVEGSNTGYGNINLLNLKKALGPSFRNASGVVQCGTAANPIALAECVPFDILGGPSTSTPEALKYVMSVGQASYGSTISNANADLSGEIFTLPAGAVGLAGGLEYRTVRGYDRPGQFEQSGFSTDLAGNSTTGHFTVREAYLELNVPLLKGVMMAELLNLNLASRYSDYSNFGSTTNSKASFMWKPIKDLLVRGTWAEGFRAPTLSDTFGGGSQSFDNYLDACDSQWGNAASNAATKARCTAAGVPVNFRQVNAAGTPVPAGGAQTPTPFQQGSGNAFLQPETAVTRTAGLVYSPSFVPGFTIGLDWFNIRVANRITGIGASFVINQCYIDGVQSFCDAIKRDPITGQINSLSRGNANLGALETEGYDLSLSYRMPRTRYGLFGFRSETTYVDSWRSKSSNTANFIEYAGEYDLFKWKSNVALDWSMGNWSVTLGNRFYGSQKTRCWTVNPVVECSNPTGLATWGTGYNKAKEIWYSDLSIGYALPWNAKLLVGANNVFNRGPIINYSASSNFGGNNSSGSTNPELPLDRFFYVRYNQSF
jgi:iron complex outermembrane receptor protein